MSEERSILKEIHHHKVSVDWTIKDFFPIRYEINQNEESPEFSLGGLQLFLVFSRKGVSCEGSNSFVGLYLTSVKNTLIDIPIAYTVGIRKRDGSIYKSYGSESNSGTHGENFFGTRKMFEASDLQKSKDRVSPDGTSLTLFCTAQVKDCSYVKAASRTWSLESVDTLLRNFQDLLLNGSHSDATIKFKDKDDVIPVHRSILAARSPVFRSMFEANILERDKGVINIGEFEPGDFHDFLLSLYTAKEDHVTPANAPALYKISHNYELKDLSKACILCMMYKMSVESFCDIILLASVYNESHLLNSMTCFFLENAREIIRHPTWSYFKASHPSLTIELLSKLAE